jgi:hypothetical protein
LTRRPVAHDDPQRFTTLKETARSSDAHSALLLVEVSNASMISREDAPMTGDAATAAPVRARGQHRRQRQPGFFGRLAQLLFRRKGS